MLFNKLRKLYSSKSAQNDSILSQIATILLKMVNKHMLFVAAKQTVFARLADPRFGRSKIHNCDCLWRNVITDTRKARSSKIFAFLSKIFAEERHERTKIK